MKGNEFIKSVISAIEYLAFYGDIDNYINCPIGIGEKEKSMKEIEITNKYMRKHEFENLVGRSIDQACYEKIEFVYENCESFSNTNGKQKIADYYKKNDMKGIEKLYTEIMIRTTGTEEFEQFVSDLALFADGYVEEIKKHLVEIAMDTFNDSTIVNLLHEYAIRKAKEQKNLADDFITSLQFPNLNINFSNNCLTNANHYKTVIAGLLVDEWWHEQNKGN